MDSVNRLLFGVSMQWPAPVWNPVGLALAAETFGFDFVSTNDHMHAGSSTGGQARASLESWTLMTWIGALTSHIKLGVCASCLAFRPPIILAKMAESLDRLSNGRLFLGLGAGSGGPDGSEMYRLGLLERTPREQLVAVREAVSVIRAAWSQPDVEFSGDAFEVRGANLEPKASRQIPIWLGATQPRALALTGQIADGWLASSFGYTLDEACSKRRVVRQAAVDAGRNPDALWFAYHASFSIGQGSAVLSGGVKEVADRLTAVVRNGFNAPHLQPVDDHVRQIEILAKEVIPEVRANVGKH